MIFTALVLSGFAGGVENANEMSFRQVVTPDVLLGRVNGTMRSANRTMGAIGALAGCPDAALLRVCPTFIGIVGVFTAAVIIAICSPLGTARDDEDTDSSSR